MRRRKGLPSFRSERAHRVLRQAVSDTRRRVLDRERGRIWADRYHRRDLAGPRAVRNALVYVLSNHIKHGEYEVGLLDPFSSAPWFSGWANELRPPSAPSAVHAPTTWVLREGWHTRGGGRLHLGEVPRARH